MKSAMRTKLVSISTYGRKNEKKLPLPPALWYNIHCDLPHFLGLQVELGET